MPQLSTGETEASKGWSRGRARWPRSQRH